MNYTPAALDNGFGFTKALTDTRGITVQSVAGEPTELLDNCFGPGKGGIVANVDGRELFVGPLAARQSPVRYFSLKENKPDDSTTKFIGLTALAMALPEDSSPVRLVTALPVNHYFTMKAAAEQSYLGHHDVIINGQSKSFEIERTRTTVQGLEALFDQLLDDSGSVVAPWAMQTVAVVDVGFYTTNLIVVHRLEPIRKLCKSIPVGISAAWRLLADFIYREKGVDLSLYEVDEIAKTNIVQAKGTEWDVSDAVGKAINNVAQEVNGQIETVWPQRPFSKILGAGGGMLRMGLKLLHGELVPVLNPQGANVNGGLKLARREATWRQTIS
ncbi:MAG: ParM/StbA family protein [Desulfitobacteriaceae bacterium]